MIARSRSQQLKKIFTRVDAHTNSITSTDLLYDDVCVVFTHFELLCVNVWPIIGCDIKESVQLDNDVEVKRFDIFNSKRCTR